MKRTLFGVLALAWLGLAGVGMGRLLVYENSPGPREAHPARWPSASTLPRSPDLATLVVILHPHCPCSRATIEELNRLMARSRGRMTVHVLMLRPAGTQSDWSHTDLLRSAAAIPGVQVHIDEDAVERDRFRAETSGETLLYAADGRLLFSGGITAARGHSGDNAGVEAILAHLGGSPDAPIGAPVFGCSLLDSPLPAIPAGASGGAGAGGN